VIKIPVRNRGFTLIETMVYCVLLALFTTIFFLALPTRSNISSENLSYSVERASMALSEINQAISNSVQGKVFIQNQGSTLVTLSATDSEQTRFTYNSSGQVMWRQWDYYILEKGQLLRAQSSLKTSMTASDAGDPPLAELSELKQTGLLANDVEAFKVSATSDGFLTQIELDTAGSSVAIETFSRPRNQ